MTALADVRRRALRSLMPPSRLRLSEWIERQLVLPEGITSALPGRVRLWPYQREIADAISDPEIGRVAEAAQSEKRRRSFWASTRSGCARRRPQDKSGDKTPGAENSTSEPKGAQLRGARLAQ
jgi:hypothetical protein